MFKTSDYTLESGSLSEERWFENYYDAANYLTDMIKNVEHDYIDHGHQIKTKVLRGPISKLSDGVRGYELYTINKENGKPQLQEVMSITTI